MFFYVTGDRGLPEKHIFFGNTRLTGKANMLELHSNSLAPNSRLRGKEGDVQMLQSHFTKESNCFCGGSQTVVRQHIKHSVVCPIILIHQLLT